VVQTLGCFSFTRFSFFPERIFPLRRKTALNPKKVPDIVKIQTVVFNAISVVVSIVVSPLQKKPSCLPDSYHGLCNRSLMPVKMELFLE
jgi:hypothetical protein